MGEVTSKHPERDKVRTRLRRAEERQRHVEIRLRRPGKAPVVGYVVRAGSKRVEVVRMAEQGLPDGVVELRLRDVDRVKWRPRPSVERVVSVPADRLARLEELEELADAVVEEAFEEGWPYDAAGVGDLTQLQLAVRELACLVRRATPSG